MPLTPADLDRIEALARAAAPGPYGVESFAIRDPRAGSVVMPGPRWLVESTATDVRSLPLADARYFAALDPDTVLALVEAARRGMARDCVVGPRLVGEVVDGEIRTRPATDADTGPARELTLPEPI